MSKQTKFLSIAIGLLQGKAEFEGDAVINNMTAEKLFGAIKDISGNPEIGGMPKEEDGLKGRLLVKTFDEKGKGVPAQVKLFKLLDGETKESFDRVNGKITMDRRVTYFNGILTADVTPGRYVVEVSKGSEYEIITDYAQILPGEVVERSYQLSRIIDLSEMGWFAGDLHHHSVYSSPVWKGTDDVVESASDVANSMMAMGLKFGCLSDHHNTFNHDAFRKTKMEDFCPIVSKEISTSNGHVMSMGVEKDVIYAIPEDEDRTDEYLRAEFRRIVKEIKDEKGLAQLNHPRDLQTAISWNPKFYDMIDIFDTVEIWNGSNPQMSGSTNDKAYKLWDELLKKGTYIPATTGSDCHNTRANDYHLFFDQLTEIYADLNKYKAEFKQYSDELYVFEKIFEHVIQVMEKWAESNLTSGGVRTFAYLGEEPSPEIVMDSLKRGNSFLTDGPILIPKISGKIPGEKAGNIGKEVELEILLLSNRPLKTLELHTNKEQTEIIDIADKNKLSAEVNHYDYSQKLWLNTDDVKWIYLIARDDCTNMAITNPIFLQ